MKLLLWLSILLKGGWLVAGFNRMAPLSEPFLTLALGGSVALILGEFAILFWWLYPLECARKGLSLSRGEYLRLRVGLVFETLAPLIAVGLIALAVAYALHGSPNKNAGEWLLMGAMGIAGVALSVLYARRGLILPVRSLRLSEHLLNEVQRMGRELGVQVREVLVLNGTRSRTVNAFALGGRRIAITDYLLANLTEREVLAVLAHEVAHLAQRRRLWRLWWLELGAAGGLVVGLAPLWQLLPAWSNPLLMAMLALGMTMPMLWLRRHHELEADTFAASQYGAEAIRSALLKVATLRGEGDKSARGIHPALRQRLDHLARFAMR